MRWRLWCLNLSQVALSIDIASQVCGGLVGWRVPCDMEKGKRPCEGEVLLSKQ